MSSEVAGYGSTMADSDVRGSERPEESEPGWKRLENLVATLAQAMDKMAQETSEIKAGYQWNKTGNK